MSGAVMLASERGEVGLAEAMQVLRDGGSAMDAVELAVRAAEANLDDHYVGVGGIPNLLGEVELDASIMDGRTRAAGAVAAVRGYPHPITIARRVMEQLPQHVMLAGAGAERFAAEMGVPPGETLTDEARRMWEEGLSENGAGSADSEGERAYRRSALEILRRQEAHDGPWGTVNVIALDRHGDLCVGVSTSGYPWKYPGRVGDSALPGAGLYSDGRVGAAACTGRGEMTMRVVGAKTVVDGIAAGLSPEAACRRMVEEAGTLVDPFASEVRALCLTPDGRHGAAARTAGATYSVMTSESDAVETFPAVLA